MSEQSGSETEQLPLAFRLDPRVAILSSLNFDGGGGDCDD